MEVENKSSLHTAFDNWISQAEPSGDLTAKKISEIAYKIALTKEMGVPMNFKLNTIKVRAENDRHNHDLFERESAIQFVVEAFKEGLYPQSWLKSHPVPAVRAANRKIKRYTTAKLAEDGPTKETSPKAHPHGSRHIRRKVSHDARKGTKQIAGGKSVCLDDADLVRLHGRAALHVLSPERYDAALAKLNEVGSRLDLKVKDGFRQTLDALAGLFERRAA